MSKRYEIYNVACGDKLISLGGTKGFEVAVTVHLTVFNREEQMYIVEKIMKFLEDYEAAKFDALKKIQL